MQPQTNTKQISSEEEEILTVAVNLARYFIKHGHTAEDLRSAILTTMNIRLQGTQYDSQRNTNSEIQGRSDRGVKICVGRG